jgi:carboxyl-terminal processing protease
MLFSFFTRRAAVGAVAALLLAATASGTGPEPANSSYEELKLLTRVVQIVRQDYVDPAKIDYKKLIRAALRGMLSELDPHSAYMEPQSFQELREDTQSRFGGLGVNMTIRDGKLTVVAPLEDSPGFKAGLLPGDILYKIDGKPTGPMDLNEAIDLLRGEPGTTITLTIIRPSTKETKDFTLTREIIRVSSVKDARILGPELGGEFKIGYARLTQFNAPSTAELDAKLGELEAKGAQAFILDLRYNPGGLLNAAVDIAGMFLPAGTEVVSTQGRLSSQGRGYKASLELRRRLDLPLAILANHGSASASEIVAGALKDLNRAIVVGETTFGKGSVQSVISLPDGSALRLTTAKYYTPSRKVIHEHGVEPTIRASFSPEQERLLMLSRREQLLSPDDKEEVKNFRDTQLERAVDALKGAMIFTRRNGAGVQANVGVGNGAGGAGAAKP